MLSSANKTRILDKSVPYRYYTPGPREFHALRGAPRGETLLLHARGTSSGLYALLLGRPADVSTYWVPRPMT